MKFLNKLMAYYNKDGVMMSVTYKGFPMSASGSSEASVKKSIAQLMAFVDYVEKKKLQQATVIESKIVEYA